MISLYPRFIFYIKQIVKTNIIKREIKNIRKNNKYLVIYGTGLYGLKYARFLNKMNIEYDYFCVTDNNQGQFEFESHKIRQLNELSGEELKETGFVIAMSPRYTKEVKRNLDLLVSQRQIYSDTIGRRIETIDECMGFRFIAGDAWY